MPKKAVNFDKLAKLARITENEIIYNLFDSEIESIYEFGKHRLGRWGLMFGKTEVHLKGESKMATKTIKVGGETPLGIAEEALLYTSFSPDAWSADWINIFDLMTKGEGQDKPMGLIRLSDHRQCWVNRAGANLFASTGAEMIRRQLDGEYYRLCSNKDSSVVEAAELA